MSSAARGFPSLVALRQTLRAASAAPGIARPLSSAQSSRSQLLHTSTSKSDQLQTHESSPASSSSVQLDAASGPALDLNDLHSQFEMDGEMYDMPPIDEGTYDEGDPIAFSNKPSIVHVPLSKLRKSPASGTASKGKLYVPLSGHVFDAPARRDIIHSAVVYYLDSLRAGTANTKTRSEVRGSGRKLRQQKGTGKARIGTMSSPLLRGGAVAHGPKPRDHSTELPRRVRELALRSTLSSKWRQGDLLVVPVLDWMPPPTSTGPLWRLLKAKGWDDALVLTAPRQPSASERWAIGARPSASDPVYEQEQRDAHKKAIKNFIVASKNLPLVEIVELDSLTEKYVEEVAKTSQEKKKPGELHAYQLLRRKKVICDIGAIEWLEEKLGGVMSHVEARFDQVHIAQQRELAEERAAARAVKEAQAAGVETQTPTETPVAAETQAQQQTPPSQTTTA